MMLPVVILAGGLATRLRPITEKIPKSLVDVNGEPFIIHQLRLLKRNGVDQVLICLGHLGEQVEGLLGDGAAMGLKIGYAYDGPTLLGTAGAIRRAWAALPDEFFVLYGDSYLDCDYLQAAQVFHDSKKQALMTVYRNEGQWDSSNVEFRNGEITTYSKKERTQRMAYIDYGLGAFKKEVFEAIPPDSPYDLAQLYQEILVRGELVGMEVFQRFYEIGSPAGLAELRQYLAGRKDHHEF